MDFFEIEFEPALIDSISLPMIFLQIKYRQQTSTSLALVLISALQAKLANGKCYQQIKDFNSTLAQRQKLKFNLNRSRKKLQNICKETDNLEIDQALINIDLGAEQYFGVRESRLSETLAPFLLKDNVKKVVKSFYAQYRTKEANFELLNAFNSFLTNIKPQYVTQINLFAREKEFKWEDNESVETYFKSLSACLDEDDILAEEAKKKNKENKNEKIKATRLAKSELESAFINFANSIEADHKYWQNTVEPINTMISKSDEYKARFGPKMSFEHTIMGNIIGAAKNFRLSKEDNKSVEQAKYIIKIFFLAKSLLSFNRLLYDYNAMMLKEMRKYNAEINMNEDEVIFFIFEKVLF